MGTSTDERTPMPNAQEQFPVVTLTRKDIAGMLNDSILSSQPIPVFEDDDERLTGDLCREVAGLWAEILDDDLSEEDRGAEERTAIATILQKHFG
jgi:hypothetical protein